jgi:hypothetical protein
VFLLITVWPHNLCMFGILLTMIIVSFLIPIFATFRIIARVSWLVLAHVVMTHNVCGILIGFVFLLLHQPILLALPLLLHLCRHLSVASSFGTSLWLLIVWIALSRSFRGCYGLWVFKSLSGLLIGKAYSDSLSLYWISVSALFWSCSFRCLGSDFFYF